MKKAKKDKEKKNATQPEKPDDKENVLISDDELEGVAGGKSIIIEN